jgi:hypothetical protein
MTINAQQKAALWRAYKQRQTANYVASRCNVSQHTAEKYVKELGFRVRLEKLRQKANEYVDEDQAMSLASTIKPIANMRVLLLDKILKQIKEGDLEASVADVDRLIRLERYLRGEPDSRTEDISSWKWLEEDDSET